MIAILTNSQTAHFLSNFESEFGITEGFRVSVLAIHKDKTF